MNNEQKGTAIVVLYYNKLRLTETCIRSILNAGYSGEMIYCFNNGSEEDVYEEIKKEFKECGHNGIVKNGGYSVGFNASLRWVFSMGYSWALFLTNDTEICKGVVEACEDTAKETGVGLIAPRITYRSDFERIDSVGGYFDKQSGVLHHYHSLDLGVLLEKGKDYIPGTAIYIQKEAFERLGGTDETFHMYWEDVDMCFRAHELGFGMARCYDGIIRHGGGQTCRKKPLYTTFYFQRNRIRFCKRHLNSLERENTLKLIGEELEKSALVWKENNDFQRLGYLEKLLEELDGVYSLKH